VRVTILESGGGAPSPVRETGLRPRHAHQDRRAIHRGIQSGRIQTDPPGRQIVPTSEALAGLGVLRDMIAAGIGRRIDEDDEASHDEGTGDDR
jgi:hypothetical protein